MNEKVIKSLFDLRIWVKAKDLTILIYRLTKKFPSSELFGLVSQIRRAAISVAANIAEGYYRQSTKELIQFLVMAKGSAGELISHLFISENLGYISKEDRDMLSKEYEGLIISINSLIKSLNSKK